MSEVVSRKCLESLLYEINWVDEKDIENHLEELPYIDGKPIGSLDFYGKQLQTLLSKKIASLDMALDSLTEVELVQSNTDASDIESLCVYLNADVCILHDLIIYSCKKLFQQDVFDWLQYEENTIIIGQNFGVYLTNIDVYEDYDAQEEGQEEKRTLH